MNIVAYGGRIVSQKRENERVKKELKLLDGKFDKIDFGDKNTVCGGEEDANNK